MNFKTPILALLLGLLAAAAPAPAGAENVTYLHTDNLGSPVLETDQNGNVLRWVEYSAYGEELGAAPADGPAFTSHYRDAGTGLVYMQQRYYDPTIGQFLAVDPFDALVEPVGFFNRYEYANSGPFRYIDPDGRSWWEDFKLGGEQLAVDLLLWENPGRVANFAVEEGPDVLLRTGTVIGGAGQVALGGSICAGIVTCAGGGLIAYQGANNIYEGFTGQDSLLRDDYRQAFGDYGDVAYEGVNLSTSIFGMARPVLKEDAWKLFRYTRDQYQPAIQGASGMEATVSTAGLVQDGSSVLDQLNQREEEGNK